MDMSILPKQSEATAIFRTTAGIDVYHEVVGVPMRQADLVVVWGHGWGQDRSALRPLAAAVRHAAHVLIDFPGFGESPRPPTTWGTADYADACFELLSSKELGRSTKVVWVGHSFGGRVGIQLASRHRNVLAGLCLIASAGLPPQRSLRQRTRLWLRVRLFKLLAKLPFLRGYSDSLRSRFGSSDYRQSGELRPVFVRVVNENLSEAAQKIECPCLLVYGSQDKETPPEIGERLAGLIPRSQLSILPNNDHYSLLADGRHLVVKRLLEFFENVR